MLLKRRGVKPRNRSPRHTPLSSQARTHKSFCNTHTLSHTLLTLTTRTHTHFSQSTHPHTLSYTHPSLSINTPTLSLFLSQNTHSHSLSLTHLSINTPTHFSQNTHSLTHTLSHKRTHASVTVEQSTQLTKQVQNVVCALLQFVNSELNNSFFQLWHFKLIFQNNLWIILWIAFVKVFCEIWFESFKFLKVVTNFGLKPPCHDNSARA